MKTCTKCKRSLDESDFKYRSDDKTKLRSQCRHCDNAYLRAYHLSNSDREKVQQKNYREINKTKLNAQWREWFVKNKKVRMAWQKEYRKRNVEKIRIDARIRAAQYRREKPYLSRARQARYRSKHREVLRIRGREYEQINKAKIADRKKRYSQTDRGKTLRRIIRQRYLARKKNAAGDFTIDQFKARCEFYGWRCYLCRTEVTIKTVVIEHRIPLSRNGTNWPANLAPSCESCNLKKHNKTEFEYRRLFA